MLVAFDFDGTLSDSEMTVLLGEQAGVADEIADITERAMNGELSYAESLRARAELLAGLPERLRERLGLLDREVPVAGERHEKRLAVEGRHRLGVDETVAVGDGANDLPMLEVAGLAVGYEPKPAVEPLCDAVVDSMADLRALFERRAVL